MRTILVAALAFAVLADPLSGQQRVDTFVQVELHRSDCDPRGREVPRDAVPGPMAGSRTWVLKSGLCPRPVTGWLLHAGGAEPDREPDARTEQRARAAAAALAALKCGDPRRRQCDPLPSARADQDGVAGVITEQVESDSMHHRLVLGARVRILASEVEVRRFSGTLTSVHRDTLVVRRRGVPVEVPFAAVDRLEVSLGRDHGRGALRGAVTGALLVLGFVYATEPGYARDGAPVFLVLGGAPGALIGALATREVWLPLEFWATSPREP